MLLPREECRLAAGKKIANEPLRVKVGEPSEHIVARDPPTKGRHGRGQRRRALGESRLNGSAEQCVLCAKSCDKLRYRRHMSDPACAVKIELGRQTLRGAANQPDRKDLLVANGRKRGSSSCLTRDLSRRSPTS
jgi:hypothetical protein